MKKPWYRSKTFWFNVALIVVAVGTFLINDETAAELLGPKVLSWFGVFVGVIGVILRAVTNMGIQLPGQNGGNKQ